MLNIYLQEKEIKLWGSFLSSIIKVKTFAVITPIMINAWLIVPNLPANYLGAS